MSITQEHNETLVRYNLSENWNCETSFSFAHLSDAILRLHVFAYTATAKAVNRFTTIGNYVIHSYLSEQKNAVLLEWVINIKRQVIEHGRQTAYAAAGQAAIMTYWNVGQRIVEEEQDGKARAEYGKQIIPLLAEQLTKDYGTGYGRRNLSYYRQFYLTFPKKEILHDFVQNLSWTHIRRILSVSDPNAQLWYLKAASCNMWSTTELDCNIARCSVLHESKQRFAAKYRLICPPKKNCTARLNSRNSSSCCNTERNKQLCQRKAE